MAEREAKWDSVSDTCMFVVVGLRNNASDKRWTTERMNTVFTRDVHIYSVDAKNEQWHSAHYTVRRTHSSRRMKECTIFMWLPDCQRMLNICASDKVDIGCGMLDF